MKTIATILLAAAIITLPVNAKEKDSPEEIEPAIAAPVLLGMLVLAVAAVGTYVVVKVYSSHKDDTGPVQVVLEKSQDHVNWTPIYTNTVVLNGQSPIDLFSDELRKESCFYRGRKL